MRRGEAREKIISVAERLFAQRWYSTVSVADICRNAGVSNGIAYHYYKNKDELLVNIMERTIDVVGSGPSLDGKGFEERLRNYVRDLLRITVQRKHLIRAFRQGQYRMLEYERRLHDVYTAHLESVLGRQVSESEYKFTMSGLRFANIRHAFDGHTADIDTLCSILTKGPFPGIPMRPLAEFLPNRVLPPAVDIVQDTRAKLLKSGKELFGGSDFASVGIADITRKAGISVGSFYSHFESKEQFLAEIIKLISSELRRFIRINMPKCETRLEEELAGLYLFCLYLTFVPLCYSVVRQGEYVVPDVARKYYDGFVRGYLKRMDWLPEGLDKGTVANFCIGIAHYLGMELAFSSEEKDIRQCMAGLVGYYASGIGRMEV
ncbi:MAG TPA: TetR/AcrR family transcriptional regulator [Bacillota bacterium]|nr:TetR/AcrR family transcriptional regulator [Bacillota bacterium]